jgi:dipeptide/tripeptide permease
MNEGLALPRAAAVRPHASAPWYRTLFLTDMWERFGFYGMQAILMFYAAAPESRGGLGLPTADAAALFGAWIGLAFMFSIPGGWVGNRLLAPRRALLVGGVIIAFGHHSLAVPAAGFTAVGLILLALGTALYKPNHQAMKQHDVRQGQADAAGSGISLMYVGNQVSTLIAAVGISAAADVLPPAFMCQTLCLLLLFAALGGGLGSRSSGSVNPCRRPRTSWVSTSPPTLAGPVSGGRAAQSPGRWQLNPPSPWSPHRLPRRLST